MISLGPYLWCLTGLGLGYLAEIDMRVRNERLFRLHEWIVTALLWPLVGIMMALGPRSPLNSRFTGLVIAAVAALEIWLFTPFGR